MKELIIKKSSKKDELILPLTNQRTLFVTGAGLSTGAGLPTYYGKDGAYTDMDSKPEDIINQYNMDNNTYKIWDAISDLIKAGANAEPTLSHKFIADICNNSKDSMIFTQNVDDLHYKASEGRGRLIQVHGKGKYSRCEKCHTYDLKSVELIETREDGKSPICPVCGHDQVKPNIVPFFGMPDRSDFESVYDFCCDKVDYCFVIGTQLTFEYIENVLYYVKRYNPDAIIININPDITPSREGFDYFYRTKSDNFFDNCFIK